MEPEPEGLVTKLIVNLKEITSTMIVECFPWLMPVATLGGSQFFICHSRQNTAHLDRNHTCFGKVVEGLEVIDQIKAGDKIEKIVVSEA